MWESLNTFYYPWALRRGGSGSTDSTRAGGREWWSTAGGPGQYGVAHAHGTRGVTTAYITGLVRRMFTVSLHRPQLIPGSAWLDCPIPLRERGPIGRDMAKRAGLPRFRCQPVRADRDGSDDVRLIPSGEERPAILGRWSSTVQARSACPMKMERKT